MAKKKNKPPIVFPDGIAKLCMDLGIRIEKFTDVHYRLHIEEKGSLDYWPSKGTIGKSFGSNFTRPESIYDYILKEWSN